MKKFKYPDTFNEKDKATLPETIACIIEDAGEDQYRGNYDTVLEALTSDTQHETGGTYVAEYKLVRIRALEVARTVLVVEAP